MTRMRTTAWFYNELDCDQFAIGWVNTAAAIDGTARVKAGSSLKSPTSDILQDIISKAHYYNGGDLTWKVETESGFVQGKVYWYGHNPENLPNTVECDITFLEKKDGRKRKGYCFTQSRDVLKFFHPLCASVQARSFLIEPLKMPDDVFHLRYNRPHEINDKHGLSNLDWIFGVRSDSTIAERMRRVEDSAYDKCEGDEFSMWCLSEHPLQYKRAEDLELVLKIERKLGVFGL